MKVSQNELPQFAERFIQSLPTEKGATAFIVNLSGDLGAGKTAFVQACAKILGVGMSVTSPTFVIMRKYDIHHPVFKRMVHIDAYRLSSEDTDTISWSIESADPASLIFVEWPLQMPGGVPKWTRSLKFSVLGENERDIEEKTHD